MTNKKIVLVAAVATGAVAIGIMIWSGAMTNAPANPGKAKQAANPEIALPPSAQLSRVRLVISNFN